VSSGVVPGGHVFASAAQLEALAGMIIGMLGGHSAVEAALSASWPAPTGASAVAANVPHMLWLGTVATMLQTAGRRSRPPANSSRWRKWPRPRLRWPTTSPNTSRSTPRISWAF
jgi:hypothetical protein